MNVGESTVRRWIKEQNLLGNRPVFGKLASSEDSFVGKNVDRHLCKTCTYRCEKGRQISCDYLFIVGHSRGCKAEDCNVYKKGEKQKAKIDMD